MIICVMVKQPILSDDIRDELMLRAYEMLRAGQSKRKVKTAVCEGQIRTKFKRALLNDLAGIEFIATIEGSFGQNTIRYIIRDRDYEEWLSAHSIAWHSQDEKMEDIPSHRWRANPLRRLVGDLN